MDAVTAIPNFQKPAAFGNEGRFCSQKTHESKNGDSGADVLQGRPRVICLFPEIWRVNLKSCRNKVVQWEKPFGVVSFWFLNTLSRTLGATMRRQAARSVVARINDMAALDIQAGLG